MPWFSPNWKAFRSFLGNAAPPSRRKFRTCRRATFETLSSREMLSASTYNASGGTLILSGSNTYTGPIQGGTVNIAGTVSANSAYTLTAGTLTADDTIAAVNPVALTLNNTTSNTSGGVTLTAGNANLSTGTMQAGTLTLNTTATYSGTTRVNGGTLVLPSGVSLTNSSSVTVGGATATLGSMPTLAGLGSITNGLTVNGVGGTGDAGHIAPHIGATVGTLQVGSPTLNGGSILDFNMGAAGGPGTSDLIASAGALTLPGAGTGNVTVNLANTGGFGTGTYKLIPESSTTNFTATRFSIGVDAIDGTGTTMVNAGSLRFNVTSGAATIGAGVTATVASAATMELAGTLSNLSDPSAANRVHIVNNSMQGSGGTLSVSGANQQVGAIDGTGTTTVTAGSSLTANHIVQNALVIGGAATTGPLTTIDASDASGLPLTSSLTLGRPLTASGLGTTLLGAGTKHSMIHVVFAFKMVSAGDPSIAAHHFAGHWAMTRAGGR